MECSKLIRELFSGGRGRNNNHISWILFPSILLSIGCKVTTRSFEVSHICEAIERKNSFLAFAYEDKYYSDIFLCDEIRGTRMQQVQAAASEIAVVTGAFLINHFKDSYHVFLPKSQLFAVIIAGRIWLFRITGTSPGNWKSI